MRPDHPSIQPTTIVPPFVGNSGISPGPDQPEMLSSILSPTEVPRVDEWEDPPLCGVDSRNSYCQMSRSHLPFDGNSRVERERISTCKGNDYELWCQINLDTLKVLKVLETGFTSSLRQSVHAGELYNATAVSFNEHAGFCQVYDGHLDFEEYSQKAYPRDDRVWYYMSVVPLRCRNEPRMEPRLGCSMSAPIPSTATSAPVETPTPGLSPTAVPRNDITAGGWWKAREEGLCGVFAPSDYCYSSFLPPPGDNEYLETCEGDIYLVFCHTDLGSQGRAEPLTSGYANSLRHSINTAEGYSNATAVTFNSETGMCDIYTEHFGFETSHHLGFVMPPRESEVDGPFLSVVAAFCQSRDTTRPPLGCWRATAPSPEENAETVPTSATGGPHAPSSLALGLEPVTTSASASISVSSLQTTPVPRNDKVVGGWRHARLERLCGVFAPSDYCPIGPPYQAYAYVETCERDVYLVWCRTDLGWNVEPVTSGYASSLRDCIDVGEDSNSTAVTFNDKTGMCCVYAEHFSFGTPPKETRHEAAFLSVVAFACANDDAMEPPLGCRRRIKGQA
jgi:hypothetical protein